MKPTRESPYEEAKYSMDGGGGGGVFMDDAGKGIDAAVCAGVLARAAAEHATAGG